VPEGKLEVQLLPARQQHTVVARRSRRIERVEFNKLRLN
jgi:hypothetical protein